MFELFKRNRYFFRFFLSRFISRIGDGVHSLALLWISYNWSKSASVVALVMISFSLPAVIMSPFAGSLADRKKRELIMVFTDIVQSLCVLALAVLSYLGFLNLFYLISITVIMSIAQAYFIPASMSIVPQLVEREDITRANGMIQITSSFSIVIGPVVGMGLIAQVGVSFAFLTNAISFLFSAFLLFGIKTYKANIHTQSLSLINTIKDGFKTIKQYPIATKLLDKTALINFFFGAITIVIPILAGKVYKLDSKGMGLMMSFYGLGMFLSSIFLGSFKAKIKPKIAIVVSIALVGVVFAVFGTIYNFYVSLASLFFIGALLNIANVNLLSVYQMQLPNEVLGRVMSFLSAISISLSPLSYALTGLFIDIMGIKWVLIVSGVLIILNALRISRVKEL